MKYDGGFRCDRKSKYIIGKRIEDIYQKSNLNVVIDYQEDNDKAGIDLYLTAYTADNKEVQKLAVEIKERPTTAHTQCTDWILEEKKLNKLKDAEKEGYKGIFAYLWSDNYYALWVIDDIHTTKGTLNVAKTTQGYNNTKYNMTKTFATLDQAKYQGYYA